MANDCDFEIKIKGPEDKVHKLEDWLSAYYSYNEGERKCVLRECVNPNPDDDSPLQWKEIPCEHHIGYRIFEYNVGDQETLDDGNYLSFGFGYCAWSCKSCMFGGPGTYYGDIENKKQERYSITLPDACKELGVEVELFSCEPGMAFTEHYHILNDGTIFINECVEYDEMFIDSDEESYQEIYCKLKEFGEDDEHIEELLLTKEDYEDGIYKTIIYCPFFGGHYIDEDDQEWPWEINE